VGAVGLAGVVVVVRRISPKRAESVLFVLGFFAIVDFITESGAAAFCGARPCASADDVVSRSAEAPIKASRIIY
jgi:hypothetical protein